MKQYLATVLNLTAVYNLSSSKFGHGDMTSSYDTIRYISILSGSQHYRRHYHHDWSVRITRFLVSSVRCAISWSCDIELLTYWVESTDTNAKSSENGIWDIAELIVFLNSSLISHSCTLVCQINENIDISVFFRYFGIFGIWNTDVGISVPTHHYYQRSAEGGRFSFRCHSVLDLVHCV